MKILILSAHPDDMETGMGGTAALLHKAGHEIIAVVTSLPKRYTDSSYEVRKKESEKAYAILGITTFYFLEMDGVSDGNFPVTKTQRKQFGAFVARIAPDAVFTQWPVDVHPDHRSLGILSIEPFLQKGVNTEVFCYEVFGDKGRPQSLGFCPTHYVDIESVVKTKEQMVRCHVSQSPTLWDGNLETQINRGSEFNTEHAEAFVRLTRVGPLQGNLGDILKRSDYQMPRGTGVRVDPAKIGIDLLDESWGRILGK